jgi:hypothetical protein
MEITQIISYILMVLFPALFGYCLRLQGEINDLKTQTAVTNDRWVKMDKVMEKLEHIEEDIKSINIELARRT